MIAAAALDYMGALTRATYDQVLSGQLVISALDSAGRAAPFYGHRADRRQPVSRLQASRKDFLANGGDDLLVEVDFLHIEA